MGLFSRHKEEKVESKIPVAPPLPPVGNVEDNSKNSNAENLVAPPIPTSQGLDDIKSQVTGSVEVSSPNETLVVQDSSNLEIDESLFDFSDIEENKNELSNVDISDFSEPQESSVTDSNLSSNTNLSFMQSGKDYSKVSKEDTYFVTTSQFKSLLEIVESVKERVKNSSESHLRLLDLKSEEDIEYENLRKDFQFIEDKLYELDSIIFEK